MDTAVNAIQNIACALGICQALSAAQMASEDSGGKVGGDDQVAALG